MPVKEVLHKKKKSEEYLKSAASFPIYFKELYN